MEWRLKFIILVVFTSLFFSTFILAAPFRQPVYSKVYFFGDSLSDIGNNQVGSAHQAPLTNLVQDDKGHSQPGEVWVRPFVRLLKQAGVLKQSTQAKVIPSRELSDKNFKSVSNTSIDYAYSGDESGGYDVIHRHEILQYHSEKDENTCVFLPPSAVTPNALCGMLNRIHQFVAENKKVDPNALYVIWVGANDLEHALNFLAENIQKGRVVQKDFVEKRMRKPTDKAIKNIVSSVSMLYTAGARNFMVINLPNLAYTPAVQFLDQTYAQKHLGEERKVIELYADITNQFNQKLNRALEGLQKRQTIHLMMPDINPLFEQMRAGKIEAFPNTSFEVNRDKVLPWFSVCCPKQTFPNYDPHRCLTSDQSPLCSGPMPVLPQRKGHYVFFNNQHPTVCAHRYIAYYLFSSLLGTKTIDLKRNLC